MKAIEALDRELARIDAFLNKISFHGDVSFHLLRLRADIQRELVKLAHKELEKP